MHQRSHHRHISPLAGITDLSIGLMRDALWLRTEGWRLNFSDTATLCLASLLVLSLLSSLIALVLAGSWDSLRPYLRDQWMRSVIAAPYIVLVLYATASRQYHEVVFLGQTPILLRGEDTADSVSRVSAQHRCVCAAAPPLSVDCGPDATVRICPVRTHRTALGDSRSGATLQTLPSFTNNTGACRPALAQSSRVEWH
jgi:hypothetical protein